MLKINLKRLLPFCLGLTILLANSCSAKKDNFKPILTSVPVVVTEQNLIKLPSDWVISSTLMNGFPTGIEVYQKTTPTNGKATKAYCIVFDPKSSVLEFKPILPDNNKKVSTLYVEEPGTKYACINGGFFGTNASYSLVIYNNTILAPNIKSLSRNYNSISTTYYPTRGAFGISASGSPEVAWVYNVGTGNGIVYSYSVPAANELNKAPASQPTSANPAGAKIWDVMNAIGGSPVLIKDNEINISDKQELIEIDNATSRARSAIGITATGKVILLAIEGNNADGGTGLNLAELAALMKDMGCTAALNLDGGGSTSLMINGQQTVKPSDAAGERPVMSAIIIKKK
ncbi:MAG: phosphodiester glycosidase family protein [Mucilaginibacter sp.]|nr:phosphodiester glycosidase family protein [Mucilaginibacter sp.]